MSSMSSYPGERLVGATDLACPGPHRIQCPHHGYRVAAEGAQPGAAARAARPEVPAPPADQAVHHQEPSAGLRALGADDRHRRGLGAPVRVVVLTWRDG